MVTTALALLLAAGALAGLLVRSGPLLARVAAWSAMLLVAALAVVPPRPAPAPLAARLAVACSAAPSAQGVEAAVRAQSGATTEAPAALQFVDGTRDLGAALAAAALQAGPRAEEVAVVWNGPVAGPPAGGAAPAGAAFTTTAPLPIVPGALQARALQRPVVDRPFGLELTLPGASEPLAVAITLVDAQGELAHADLWIPKHGGVEFRTQPRVPGELGIRVTLEVAGHRIERRGSIDVGAAAPVLVLDPSGVAAASLQAQGLAVTTAAELPPELAGHPVAIVGGPLPVAAQQALVAAVDGGLGLLVLGPGVQAEGAPLRDLLPLQVRAARAGADGGGAEPPPTPPPTPSPPSNGPPTGRTDGAEIAPGGPVEVDKRAIAMVLVVDRSGSMGQRLPGGATKMSYAKTSAMQTARALGEGDEVGLVTFGNKGQGRIVLPLTPATDRTTVERGIQGLAEANEYTYLLAGLRVADELLSASSAAVRHAVVITDGEFYLDEDLALRGLAHAMRTRGVTLSIVSIVDRETRIEFRRAAELLAREGGGAFVPVQDARSVPVVVSAEVARSLGQVGRRPRDDAGEQPRAEPAAPKPPAPQPPQPPPPGAVRLPVRAVAASPLLLPTPAAWPTIGGVVDAAARADAQVLLVAGERGQPLLVFRNFGLGRVAALATDLGGADGAEFRADTAFPGRFAQWVMALSAPVATAEPGDLLRTTTVTPPAPAPDEATALAALAGGVLQPFAALRLPPPRTEIRYQSRVPDWAIAALAALLGLAVVERWLARRVAG